MKTKNLYQHEDGGFYCLMSDDAPLKCPVTSEWLPGIIYSSTDGRLRSTTRIRWDARFKAVTEYTDGDETVHNLIRRCDPTATAFNFEEVFESWHTAEMGVTSNMLALAVAACLESFYWGGARRTSVASKTDLHQIAEADITITSQDLQRVLQTYHVESVPEPHGFRFVIRK